MGKRGLNPVAVARTTAEARRGQAWVERLLVRVPSLAAFASRIVLSMSRGRVRAALVRHAVARAYAAFNRRDWELNTLAMDDARYEFVNTDPSRDMIGMADVAGVAGYVEMMERWHEGWDAVGVALVPGSEVRDAGPNALLALDSWRAQGGHSGMNLDLDMATLYEFEDGLGVRHTLYWDVERALAEHSLR